MPSIKATYAKTLVKKHKLAFFEDSNAYVHLSDMGSDKIFGFTFIEDGPPSEHIQICNDFEWNKCHGRLSQDKKCAHKHWHEPNCTHILANDKCNCGWDNG